ncbi:MAG: mevalonate kinase [Methanomassiliicoccaceae archaeon]|jgi:mevalonate kinase|nr:mevalonate kinase [Euryarchaeota archaeon]HOB39150.1 mevalonate kinase [Methanomassiliicoccaceae archaeon]HQA22014.1 mevalonate kinase [Methanomassiliicoccaceae archaeon]HQD88773.1 mevalonate kinase [Methanomassiliicoccaceae archaeon]
MPVVSAPGKIILLGEHAVVFGKPAIAMGIDMRLTCKVAEGRSNMVNGQPLSDRYHSYIAVAIRDHWDGGPLNVTVDSEIPTGSGLGSSAALSVALLGAMSAMRGGIDEEGVARAAFDVESKVQGRASPLDTSVSCHGHGVYIDSIEGEGLLWHIERDVRQWYVHHCQVPDLTFVIGFTGVRAPTGPLVAKVKRYVDRTRFAMEVVDEIGTITEEGARRLRDRDVVALGGLMTRDHNLLTILGVSSPELQRLVDAALPYSYGAKLTGAGGGGSMIALTDRPEKVVEAIQRRGGTPYVVRTGVDGVRVEGD